MAIEKNSFKVSRLDSEFSPYGKDNNTTVVSSEDEELQKKNVRAVESDDEDEDDEFDDCDSGAGSDDIDLLEIGESGEEFCQVGDQKCSIPVELYDLPGLCDILSIDAWNEVLSEDERFSLTQYLPDMDQENFIRTLMELFTGSNLHFGSPLDNLFDMLKGGLCEPRVAMYRQGMGFFQKRQHYHRLREYQNRMVSGLCQMKDAWSNCKGYSIEEKLQVLNIMKSQNENMEELKSDDSEMEESGDGLWTKKAKDKKHGKKVARQSGYNLGSASDVPPMAMPKGLEPGKSRKQAKKGGMKTGGSKAVMPKEQAGGFSSAHSETVPPPQHNRMGGYQMVGSDDNGESMYEAGLQREQNNSWSRFLNRTGTSKMGKKNEGVGVGVGVGVDEYTDNFVGSHTYGKNKGAVNQLSDIRVLTSKPAGARIPYGFADSVKNLGNFHQLSAGDQMRYVKGRLPNLALKGAEMGMVDVHGRPWLGQEQGGFPVEQSSKYGDWNGRSKKWNGNQDPSELGINNGVYDPMKIQQLAMMERLKEASLQRAIQAGGQYSGVGGFPRNNSTESDSSEQIDEDEDDNPLMRSKRAFPSGASGAKFGRDMQKSKLAEKHVNDEIWNLDRLSQPPRGLISDFSLHQQMMMRTGNPIWRAAQKGKMHDISQIQPPFQPPPGDFSENYFLDTGRLTGGVDWQQLYKTGRNGHILGDQSGRLHIPAFTPNLDRRKWDPYGDYGVAQQPSFPVTNGVEDDDSFLIKSLAENAKVSSRLGKRGQPVEMHAGNLLDGSGAQLIACNSASKKRKVKDGENFIDEGDIMNYLNQLQVEDPDGSKKRGKKKAMEDTDEIPIIEIEEDVEPEPKPQKKPFVPITPTFHTGFSFSIVHLLTAVRMVMITLLPEDSSEPVKVLDQAEATASSAKEEDQPVVDLDVNKPLEASSSSQQANLPALSVQEIVNRVRTNPRDPAILETQEPLQDLIRGVLKIFASKTAPLAAKGWKPLVVYERANKCWSWIGPANLIPVNPEFPDEITSPESWGLSHKMLVKLVDSFANWLKNGQETLQQIGSLPAPPSTLTEFNLDEKDRFKDLRAQKSLSTITPSSEEVKSYFRKEEVLRYSIPDRAFSYTAFDGKKSIVAPLRRCGGKPTSKARDHFMLKKDRPPHVTILCLVRDAAARLPGSIGTRADVCTLIRDSQYITEEVSDAQVNQVVSGALDRLHYERDPCVQFDGERKLWKYLHRDREEEDFEDDGTSSTKKWKRQRKDANESDMGGPTADGTGGDLVGPDAEFMDDLTGAGDGSAEIVEQSVDIDSNAPAAASSMVWEDLGLNPLQDSNGLMCQENSTTEEFEDDMFCGEPIV